MNCASDGCITMLVGRRKVYVDVLTVACVVQIINVSTIAHCLIKWLATRFCLHQLDLVANRKPDVSLHKRKAV